MDFRQATNLFADPNFDGDPVSIYEPKPGDDILPPDDGEQEPPNDNEIVIVDPEPPKPPIIGDSPPDDTPKKYVVGDVKVTVMHERVQYYGQDGKLITESLKDFTKKTILKEYKSLDEFLQQWSMAEKKCAVIRYLQNEGILFEELSEELGKNMDPFDLVSHIAFDQPALTRRERVNNAKKRDYFTKYGEQAKAVIDALLEKYADEGIENIEDIEILRVNPFNNFGSPIEIVQMFGGRAQYDKALHEVEELIYQN